MWSIQGVPHLLIPSAPTLVPSASSAIVVPLRNSTTSLSLPTYIPALNRHGWARHLFFSFFEDPDSLPRTVRKTCGSQYNPAKHPDLTLFDTTCPHDLRETARESRATALNWALDEVRRAQSASQHTTVGRDVDRAIPATTSAVEVQPGPQQQGATGSVSNPFA